MRCKSCCISISHWICADLGCMTLHGVEMISFGSILKTRAFVILKFELARSYLICNVLVKSFNFLRTACLRIIRSMILGVFEQRSPIRR